MDDISEQWTERARYDLDTADAMLKAGRYLYVLFCCQQAVEKALKAVVVTRTGQFLRELAAYYIPTRYPEEVADLASEVKREQAQHVLTQSKEFTQWLRSISQ